MTSLASFATELLLNIIEFLDPPHDFASPDPTPTTPLKNLSLTCHRLHAICTPQLFRSLHLHLTHPHTASTLTSLRSFLHTHNLTTHPTHIAITFHHNWNTNKLGLPLKKLLWELQPHSLTLHQSRQSNSLREKSAKWAYSLDTLHLLRIVTIDDDALLKMLLLRSCPATHTLHIDDGSFREIYERDTYYHHNPHQRPGAAALKPSVFPNVRVVVYTARWPSYHRFDNFLEFVVRLRGVVRFEVTLMGGEEGELRLEKRGYRVSEDAVRWREMVAAYQILAGRVEGMQGLECVVVGDKRVPWGEETEGPPSFVCEGDGVYRRIIRGMGMGDGGDGERLRE